MHSSVRVDIHHTFYLSGQPVIKGRKKHKTLWASLSSMMCGVVVPQPKYSNTTKNKQTVNIYLIVDIYIIHTLYGLGRLMIDMLGRYNASSRVSQLPSVTSTASEMRYLFGCVANTHAAHMPGEHWWLSTVTVL